MSTPNPTNFPVPPSFDAVQAKLKQNLLDKIVEAVQEGTLHVPEYANWQAESIDYALAPNLVRHKAKKHLVAEGQETSTEEEKDESGFEMPDVSNNGLYIKVFGFEIRILKSSEDGSVPLPGESETRKNFYNQRQAHLDFSQPVWNLIVHWTVDSDYNLLSLSIALPLEITKNDMGRAIVECAFDEPFWRRPPQASISSIANAPTPPPSSLDIEGIAEEEEKIGEGPKTE